MHDHNPKPNIIQLSRVTEASKHLQKAFDLNFTIMLFEGLPMICSPLKGDEPGPYYAVGYPEFP
jgi:hypothetical protein